jgi:hypothetical protein
MMRSIGFIKISEFSSMGSLIKWNDNQIELVGFDHIKSILTKTISTKMTQFVILSVVTISIGLTLNAHKEVIGLIFLALIMMNIILLENPLKNVLVVSHKWENPDNPDPFGITFAEIMKNVKPNHTLLFIDYCCIPQKPRSDDEESMFQSGLKELNWLYMLCDVIQIRSMGYFKSSWCTYESFVSSNYTGTSLDKLRYNPKKTTRIFINLIFLPINLFKFILIGDYTLLDWEDGESEDHIGSWYNETVITNGGDKEIILKLLIDHKNCVDSSRNKLLYLVILCSIGTTMFTLSTIIMIFLGVRFKDNSYEFETEARESDLWTILSYIMIIILTFMGSAHLINSVLDRSYRPIFQKSLEKALG